MVECARCGHCARLPEAALPDYGVKPNAPIASFVKRLTCVECGKSERACLSFRGRAPETDGTIQITSGECYGPGAESESDPVGRR